jgi:phosphoesterase family protein/Big-like domain-containing protein
MYPTPRSLYSLTLLLALCASALAQVPHSSHIWVISEENHSYENVETAMPYLMSLAAKYGLATQHYSDMHNSLSALMHQVAGATVTTNDSTTLTFDVDNLARQLILKGLTFKAYEEDLPYPGYLGLSYSYYVKRHDPLAYFTDVADSSMKYRLVPFTQLATDLQNHTTANFNWITPNLKDDAHDGTMAAADYWLSQKVPAILKAPEFQPGGDGVLFIIFDEGNLSTDNRCSAQVSTYCGGRVATVIIGPQIKPGYRSPTWYNHESFLKTVCVAMGLSTCPGWAQNAYPMADFFVGSGSDATTKPVVEFEKLQPGIVVPGNPLSMAAFATESAHPVTGWALYVDGAVAYSTPGPTYSITPKLTLANGGHQLHARAWDSSGAYGDAYVSITATRPALSIIEPTASTVSTTFTISASATDPYAKITSWKVYVDGTCVYSTTTATSSISISKTLTVGTHTISVYTWDSVGAGAKKSFSVSVQ